MKLKLLAGAALAALCFGGVGAAQAEPDGWYGAVDVGYHWPDGYKYSSSGVSTTPRSHASP